MRFQSTKSSQWIVFAIFYLFSATLLILTSASELSLNEIKYVLHKRGFNEPSRLHSLSGGIKRSLSFNHRKRDGTENGSGSDDTKTNESDSDSTSDDYELKQAYFAPNVSETHALLSKKLSVNKFMETHRSDWIGCCSESLTAGSEKFQKNETFGWFHFQQNFDKSKIIDEIIVTIDVGCYEVSQYDPTGEHPGTPINDFTQEVIEKLQWTKEKAKKDAKALREEFAKKSSNSTSTAEKKKNDEGTNSGAEKSKDDTSKTGDDNNTEKKKPSETTTQTGNDANKKADDTSSTTFDDTNATTSDETSTTNDKSNDTGDTNSR